MTTIKELIRKAYLIRSQIENKSDIEEIIKWFEDYLEGLEVERNLQQWKDENNRDSGEPWI